jgi:ubiquinone/menaquinone biosynthesis C-methylase UbiE
MQLDFARPDPVTYLDTAARIGATYKRAALELLDLREGQSVLDVGCGPGTDLGELAAAVGPTGMVLGLDHDPAMAARALERIHGPESAAEEPTRARITLTVGDVHALPFATGTVRRVRTDRMLQHVAEPAAAVRELRRVVRDGGRVVFAEPDWETLTVDHPTPALSRAYTQFIVDRMIRNPRIGRELPRFAIDAGFAVPDVVPAPTVFRDLRTADSVLGIGRNTRRAIEAGYLTAAAGDAFTAGLASGPFFAAVSLYLVVAVA